MKYDVVITYGKIVEAENKEQAIQIASNAFTILSINDIANLAECVEVSNNYE